MATRISPVAARLCFARRFGLLRISSARFKFKEGRTDYRGQTGHHMKAKGAQVRDWANIAKIRDLIAEDARSTLKEFSIESGLAKTTIQQSLVTIFDIVNVQQQKLGTFF